MTEPNVLNYFLIILGGFGVVWSYRFFSKLQDRKIGEFEYAAFSALWGIPIFLFFLWVIKPSTDLLRGIFDVPMMASPTLFLLGILLGYLLSEIRTLALYLKKRFGKKGAS